MYADVSSVNISWIFFISCIVWGSLAPASPCLNFGNRTSGPPVSTRRDISQSRLSSNVATLFACETKPKEKCHYTIYILSGNYIMFNLNRNYYFYLLKLRLFVQCDAQTFHFRSFLSASGSYPCKNFQSRLRSAFSVVISTLGSLWSVSSLQAICSFQGQRQVCILSDTI